jgi:acyl-CoA synthetase (AMP-forming)/AMP-acid ligase II
MLPIDNFFRAAALWPDRVAFEIAYADGCQQISYAAQAHMTRAMAAGLQAINPQPQSRVGICANNNFEHLLAWLGCFAPGKVWVPLNPRNGQEELNRIIDVTDPSAIVFDVDCADKFDRKTAQLISANGTHERADDHIDDMLDRYKGVQPQTFQASLNDLQAINLPAGLRVCQKV